MADPTIKSGDVLYVDDPYGLWSNPDSDETAGAGQNDGAGGAEGGSGSHVRVKSTSQGGDGSGEGSGNGSGNGSGEGGVEEPENDADFERGKDIYTQVAMKLIHLIEVIMDRRAKRLEIMAQLSELLQLTAEREAEKTVEEVQRALDKKKSGIWGKVFAVASLVLAVALVATGVGSPLAAWIMLAASAVLAGGTLFNDDKINNFINNKIIGNIVKGVSWALQKLGMDEEAANYLALALVMVAIIVGSIAMGGAGAKNSVSTAATSATNAAKAADKAQDAAAAAKAAHAAGKAKNAKKFVDRAQDQADIAVDNYRTAKNAAETARQKADSLTALSDANPNNVRLAKKAENAREAADAAEESANAALQSAQQAQDAAKSARQVVYGKDASDAFYKTRADKVTKQIEDGKVVAEGAEEGTEIGVKTKKSVEDADVVFKDVPFKSQTLAKLRTALLIAEGLNNAGSAVYQATIQIINAKLDYLMAQDQADIRELRALLALLQQVLEMMQGEDEHAQEAVEGAIQMLTSYLRSTMPVLVKPLNATRA